MLAKIWKYFSDLGVDPALSDDEIRRIRLLNRAAFITNDILIVYLLIELIVGITYFVLPIIFMVSLIWLNFYFMERRWYALAKNASVIVMFACIAYFAIMIGENSAVMTLFAPLIIMPLIIYKKHTTAIYAALLFLAGFVTIHILQQHIDPLLRVKPEVLSLFRFLNIVFACMSTFLMTFFFKMEDENYEQNILRMKDMIEDKNKEILDSIFYARHIQRSILPPEHRIHDFFQEAFIIFKPKDIVAGDFYFIERLDNKAIVVAACDCTGHGVPGAMVSVVCANALSRSVKEFSLSDPAEILDKTRELVIESFSRSNEEVRDGMDVSLAVFYPEKNYLEWSGANNPVWIIRGQELIEWKGDKQPIGKHTALKPFTRHHAFLEKGDCVYLFSDGFADQFGGDPKSRSGGKKFKHTNFKKLLLEIHPQLLEKQKEEIIHTFESWRGEFEQVDDVCVIGIRI